mgnify:CR=1 FL=1
MSPEDWVFRRERDYPLSYVLTGADREYIKTGRRSDHPSTNPNKRIQKKIGRLGNRIEDLFVDVALLDSEEWLSPEDRKTMLKRLGNCERYPKMKNMMVCGDIQNRHITLGYKFGSMLERLHHIKNECNEEDLLWGVILAFYGEKVRHQTQEQVSLQELSEFIEEKSLERQELAETHKQQSSVDENMSNTRNEKKKKVNVFLQEHGLSSNDTLAQALIERFNIDPIDSPEKFKNKLQKVSRETPLKEVNQLGRAIESDIDDVFNKQVQGVQAVKVLDAILERTTGKLNLSSESVIDRHKIYNGIEDSVDKKSFTRTIRHLGGQYDRSEWPKYPLLEKLEEGWTVSAYGSLLAYCEYNSYHQDITWIYHQWAFPRQSIKDWVKYVLPAINEISDEEYGTQWIPGHSTYDEVE